MPLTGSRWVGVVDGNTDPRMLPRLELSANGRLAGYTGCNMLAGKWRVEGGTIRLEALAATKRGCMGPAGDVEKRFLASVNGKSRVSLEGTALVVEGQGGERIAFADDPSNP